MIIAIASKRLPKINGVKRAVEKLTAQFGLPGPAGSPVRFETFDTPSGVSETPTSIEELMQGARQRAETIFTPAKHERVFAVGVEGGLFRSGEKAFLQSWACVFDGERITFGGSGSIEIPTLLITEVIERHIDLGVAIDRFAQQADVRSRQGTFGVLTNDLITRENSFELSALNAFMPFFHQKIYGSSGNK